MDGLGDGGCVYLRRSSSRKRSAAPAIAANVSVRLLNEADCCLDGIDGLLRFVRSGRQQLEQVRDRFPADCFEGGVAAATMPESRSGATVIPRRRNVRRPWLVYHRGYRW